VTLSVRFVRRAMRLIIFLPSFYSVHSILLPYLTL
jgi:hypothetical protein